MSDSKTRDLRQRAADARGVAEGIRNTWSSERTARAIEALAAGLEIAAGEIERMQQDIATLKARTRPS